METIRVWSSRNQEEVMIDIPQPAPPDGIPDPSWMEDDDLRNLAQQLHDERCSTYGCTHFPTAKDWIFAKRILEKP